MPEEEIEKKASWIEWLARLLAMAIIVIGALYFLGIFNPKTYEAPPQTYICDTPCVNATEDIGCDVVFGMKFNQTFGQAEGWKVHLNSTYCERMAEHCKDLVNCKYDGMYWIDWQG